ncbi:MAG: hypothetical protein MZW92_55705 [Comamonadaceae bacterium]|nr:hypothetical protein [Comamonadaceae bacterium]
MPYQVFAVADGAPDPGRRQRRPVRAASARSAGCAGAGRRRRASRRTPTACATATTLVPLLEPIAARAPRADWLAGAGGRRRALRADQRPRARSFADPQVRRARHARSSCQHPLAGTIDARRQPDEAVGDAAGAAAARRRCSAQHTDEVLREVGLDDAAIASLRERGIV